MPHRCRTASLLPVIAAKDELPADVLTAHPALQDKFELSGDGEAEQMVAPEHEDDEDDDEDDDE